MTALTEIARNLNPAARREIDRLPWWSAVRWMSGGYGHPPTSRLPVDGADAWPHTMMKQP